MRQLVVVVALTLGAGCQRRASEIVLPRGWAGEVPICERARAPEGKVLTGAGQNLRAIGTGRATLSCADGDRDVLVVEVDHLAIKGPTSLTDAVEDYELVAYGAGDKALYLGRPALGVVAWSVSAPATIEGGFEHPHASDAPRSFARLRVDAVGQHVWIHAAFADKSVDLEVTRTK